MRRIFFIVAMSVFSMNAVAEACSYREALIAYQNGNNIRGHALMKMAANDGDRRALTYLNQFKQNSTVLAQVSNIPGKSGQSEVTGWD